MTAARAIAAAVLISGAGLGSSACEGKQRDFDSTAGGVAGQEAVVGGSAGSSGRAGGGEMTTGGMTTGAMGGSDAGAAGAAGGTTCTPGTVRCSDLQPQLCDESGEWRSNGEPCELVCSAGTCASCAPEMKQCSGRQPVVCNGGLWLNTGPLCEFVCDPNSGACKGECSPGATRCSDLQPQVCNTEGTWQDMGDACPVFCNAGSCAACTPDAKTCNGPQPQRCDDAGRWQDVGSACSGCSSCSTATGACIVDSGTVCNDNNACTTGEKCQPNGTCAGGNAVSCSGADQCHTVGACVPASGCPMPVVKSGSCQDNNPCVLGESCQANGSCGGGTQASISTSCGNNKFCDGKGACKCRTQSSGNLLSNPGLNGSAASWSLGGGATYASTDVDNCSGSGSIALMALGATFSQCVSVNPNTTYHLAYRFKASDGPSSAGTVMCRVLSFWSGNNCVFGQEASTADFDQSYSNDSWIQGSGTVTMNALTTQAMVQCAAAAAAGYYDQFYFGSATPGVPAF